MERKRARIEWGGGGGGGNRVDLPDLLRALILVWIILLVW